MGVVDCNSPASLAILSAVILHSADSSRVPLNNRVIVGVRMDVVEGACADSATCNWVQDGRANKICNLQACVIVADAENGGLFN